MTFLGIAVEKYSFQSESEHVKQGCRRVMTVLDVELVKLHNLLLNRLFDLLVFDYQLIISHFLALRLVGWYFGFLNRDGKKVLGRGE